MLARPNMLKTTASPDGWMGSRVDSEVRNTLAQLQQEPKGHHGHVTQMRSVLMLMGLTAFSASLNTISHG